MREASRCGSGFRHARQQRCARPTTLLYRRSEDAVKQTVWYCLFALLTFAVQGIADGALAESVSVPEAPPVSDIVTLKDGSVLYGEVIEMAGGILFFKTAAASDNMVKIKWGEVTNLSINHPVPFHLKEGTILIGTTKDGPDGTLNIQAEPLKASMIIPLASVTAVNPMIQPPVIYTGSLKAGYSQAVGNSRLLNISVLGDFVARSEQLRLSVNGRYVYGDNAGSLVTRNAMGTIKLDFFVTKRFYWFASAYFESDTFQDIKLRTALSTGPGYQWIERGDFGGIYKDMTFHTEAGLAYFNEDYRVAADDSSFRARVAMKWNWPLFDDRIVLYHSNEIFPSLQNASNFYFTMDNGIRVKLIAGLVSGFQVTTRYNNRPPTGTTDTDNLYFFTLGYAFDTTRKR
jgi:putative salt-induced outer membrane protein YdiY